MDKIVRVFELEKETRRTYRYREVQQSEPEAVGMLYIQKWVIDNPPPRQVTATIETTK